MLTKEIEEKINELIVKVCEITKDINRLRQEIYQLLEALRNQEKE